MYECDACRSPWKRLFEVMFLVLITAALWFSVAYSSPCKALPVQVRSFFHICWSYSMHLLSVCHCKIVQSSSKHRQFDDTVFTWEALIS